MTHKYSAGQEVYYQPAYGLSGNGGRYKIVRPLPIEKDNRISYRIKSVAENVERVAEEHQLSKD